MNIPTLYYEYLKIRVQDRVSFIFYILLIIIMSKSKDNNLLKIDICVINQNKRNKRQKPMYKSNIRQKLRLPSIEI